ncbi:transcriptional regulator [Streptomyces sp. NBC_01433]|uniref:transcriptional regulator n=1 Tax=Streptomyces sp. NBC_01433 TaxID=2903864 RepID=UPI00225AB397|nr:transcriptional regulator [Streptomyces sp. NBC_01433]MCX4681796.1 transcriptional regulator [Streptomyces sp. NBC_01433]
MKSADADLRVPEHPTHLVRIDALIPADSPRLNGIDPSHVRRLAAVYTSLPPVLVHRPTMRVVDGMHRIGAATLKGLEAVEVKFFEGAEDQVFLQSVSANISNGLPLSVADRKTAAQRILASHPSLSDRAVATHVGLDAKTVAGVRVCSAAGSPLLNIRTGADGRAHPLDRTAERIHAAALLTRDPALPLRAVVERTGLSLGTAHDVRRRLLRGEDPVPQSRQGTVPAARQDPDQEPARAPDALVPAPEPAVAADPAAQAAVRAPRAPFSPRSRAPMDTLRKLANDPSLRHTDSGREFVRWLHTRFIVDEAWRKRADAVPPHCVDSMAELAQHCSDAWRRFAEDLVRRRHTGSAGIPEIRTTQPTRR